MIETFLVALLVGGAVLCLWLGLNKSDTNLVRERLAVFAPGGGTKPPVTVLEDLELAKPFRERVIKPFLAQISRLTSRMSPGNTMEKTEMNLAQAGNPRGLNVESFFGLKGVVAVVLGVLVTLIMYLNPLPGTIPYPPEVPLSALIWAVCAIVLGFFFPDLWIRDEKKRRQKRIGKALPDTIDIIAISVEAGLGFDAAVQRVASKAKDDLSLEFERYLLELRLGKSRKEALRNIIWRTGVPDLSSFITAIIQADTLGVSIANVLRIQSDQMRIRRRQRAEELAHKAPIKMLFPMALFIFPAIFVVILGPIVPQIQSGLGSK
ncbi:MAG TPA: type II secretion system F family protein [Chloroflexota bacterium]|nr:type II secretion system F family protein [Chloroflexota bacterium]